MSTENNTFLNRGQIEFSFLKQILSYYNFLVEIIGRSIKMKENHMLAQLLGKKGLHLTFYEDHKYENPNLKFKILEKS